MVPESPEQVNDARAKNHGITRIISLARVNELFENTFVNRRNCSFTLLTGPTPIFETVFSANLSLAPFMILPIVIFEFVSKTKRRCRRL
jgi:hypothetical protein